MTDTFLLNLQSLARIGALLNWAEFLVAIGVIFAVVSFALMLAQLILTREAARDRAEAARLRSLAAQWLRRAYTRERDLSEIQDELVEYVTAPDEEADRLCGCEDCETGRYHRTLSTCVIVQRGEALT